MAALYFIRDCLDRFWAGEGRWSDKPSEAMLFCRETRRGEAKNRYCLGDDKADTFTVRVVVTVHAATLVEEELASFLGRHREFFIGGPPGKEGLLLEIVPDTLRKVEAMMSLIEPVHRNGRRTTLPSQPPWLPSPPSVATLRPHWRSGSGCLPTTSVSWRGEWRTGYASTAAVADWERRGSCWRR